MPEGKARKNRLYLDVYVDDPDAWISRVEELDATGLHVLDGAGGWSRVLADPAGNEFCSCLEATPG